MGLPETEVEQRVADCLQILNIEALQDRQPVREIYGSMGKKIFLESKVKQPAKKRIYKETSHLI